MGSDYEYESSSSVGSFKHGKDKKKDKKDKDKKDKGKDKDKEDKHKDKHKEKEGKEKDKDKKEKKDKDKDEKDKGKEKKDKDKEKKDKDKEKDKKDKDKDEKDKKDKKDESHPIAGSSSGLGGSKLYNAGVAGISASLASLGLGSGAARGSPPNVPSAEHHVGGYDASSYHAAAAPPVPVPTVPSFPSTTTTPSTNSQYPANMSFDQSIPPSGYRVPLDSSDRSPFPTDFHQTGPPVAHDLDGSPIFIGSALMENAVHPCKIGPHLEPPCQVAYGGGELGHWGRYDLLPFDPNTMEWVHTEYGRIPYGRRPVEGGYEDGGKLYHALAPVNGVQVPGKTGEHL